MKPTLCVAAAWTLAAALAAAQDATRFADLPAQNLFQRSRAVVVRTGTVRALRSLILRGRMQSAADDGSPLDGRVEIKILLPDYFLQTETYGPLERMSGFAGKSLLTAIRDHGKTELPPGNLTSALLKLAHAHLTRLMLGSTTYITADQELTFRTSGGVAEMVDPRQQGRAAARSTDPTVGARASAIVTNGASDPFSMDVASESFSARFVVDHLSQAPAQLVYQGAKQVPTTMAFADRREVGGLLMPYRIATTAGDRVVETLTFDEILVNPELSKNEFSRGPR
jgi:hypothetical protein